MKRIASILGLGLLFGCSVTAKLYQVQTTPVIAPSSLSQPLTAKIEFVGLGKSGNISVFLSSGEVCKGLYSFVEPNPKSLDRNILSSVWDTIYGPGYYVAHVLGTNHAVAELSGNQGTTLIMDFYRTPGEDQNSQIIGVAKDSKSNAYKVGF